MSQSLPNCKSLCKRPLSSESPIWVGPIAPFHFNVNVGPQIALRNPIRFYFTVYEGKIVDDLSPLSSSWIYTNSRLKKSKKGPLAREAAPEGLRGVAEREKQPFRLTPFGTSPYISETANL